MRVLLDREGESGRGDLEEAWQRAETFAFLPERNGGIATWVGEALREIPEPMREGHFALLSSGTTGEPKLVFGARDRAERLTRALHRVQDSEPVHRAIGLLPLTYSYALVNQWLWSRTHGREFVATAGFTEPEATATALSEGGDTMVCLVAGQLPLIRRHFGERSFPGVVRLHFAGSRFPQERLPEIRRAFPAAAIFNNYGCVEAMPRLAIRAADDGSSGSDIGHPLPGVELRTEPDGGLAFRSVYAAVGYSDGLGFHALAPEAWISTGDQGHRKDDGHWHLDGRVSEVFKRFGVKVSLPFLLDSLSEAWRGSAAFYCETDELGEPGHVLLLAPRPSSEALRSILGTFRRDHSRTHWPLRIESLPEMPLLPNAKVDVAKARGMIERRVEWSQRLG